MLYALIRKLKLIMRVSLPFQREWDREREGTIVFCMPFLTIIGVSHGGYEDSLTITIMIIPISIDRLLWASSMLNGLYHLKGRHSHGQRGKQRLRDGEELPEVTISTGSWLH